MKAKWFAILVGVVATNFAHAHAHLESSMPADKAVLDKPPGELMLHFSEPTKLTAVTLQKEGEGQANKLSPLPSEPSAAVTLPLQKLSVGQYTVEWRAVGSDNHVMKGTFHFTVSAAAK